MIIQLFTRDDETGILDGELRDGDVFATKLDSEEGTIGGIEKRTYLFIKVPDPPKIESFGKELVKPEYMPAPSGSTEPEIRYGRKYRIDWRTKFTQDEIDLIESAADTLPDGPTFGGGTVTAGVVSGLFTVNDLIRK